MSIILQTERLILRKMSQQDFQGLAEMMQNSRVVYAYEHDFSDEDVQIWLDRQLTQYQKYGLWAVTLKSSGIMIGQAGLTMQPYKDSQILEIGYLLKEKYWHHGYAREAAAGCKHYAFEQLNQNKVYSIIKTDNYPSMKVAQSIGMTKQDEFITQYYNGDMLHYLYSVSR